MTFARLSDEINIKKNGLSKYEKNHLIRKFVGLHL